LPVCRARAAFRDRRGSRFRSSDQRTADRPSSSSGRRSADRDDRRLGSLASTVRWREADITQTVLPMHAYDVWHDRAVFHFLTTPEARAAYVSNIRRSVKPGGYVIVATFGPEGPERCSGLPVCRYDAVALSNELGEDFTLVESLLDVHLTPGGASQQFLYCSFRLTQAKTQAA
jgi:SAM-dependent methyltransferase